jgi:hypothetical protein
MSLRAGMSQSWVEIGRYEKLQAMLVSNTIDPH